MWYTIPTDFAGWKAAFFLLEQERRLGLGLEPAARGSGYRDHHPRKRHVTWLSPHEENKVRLAFPWPLCRMFVTLGWKDALIAYRLS